MQPASLENLKKNRFPKGHQHGRVTQFKKGNTASLRSGVTSPRAQLARLPGQEQLRALLTSRRAEHHADQGSEAIGIVLRDFLDRYERLWVLESTLWTRIEKEGVLSGKGRTRASVTLYLSIVDRMTKMAEKLGFGRKAKSIPDLDTFLKSRSEP